MTEHTTITAAGPRAPAPGTGAAAEAIGVGAPPGFIELAALRGMSVDHVLGYFRDERVVIFSYCPGGSEVLWKDGHSSGFGTGGWRFFLWEIVPLAARYGAILGDEAKVGTHVLVVDRERTVAYVAPRAAADSYLTAIHGHRPVCDDMDCGDFHRWHA